MTGPKQRSLIQGFVRILPLLLLLPLVVACGQQTAERPPLKVVATLAPLADWARHVGGERVQVTQLVPMGIDPPTYTPTAENVRALAEADVVLLNGLELEPWLEPALMVAKPRRFVSLDLSQFVGPAAGQRRVVREPTSLDDQNSSRELTFVSPPVASPYLWLDPGPEMAQRAVAMIGDTFTRVDPDYLLTYRRNAERYNGDLENLDIWIRQQVRAWPRTKPTDIVPIRVLDRSWQYFALRYGVSLRVVSDPQTQKSSVAAAAPVFVDQWSQNAETLKLLSLRQPDGVLNPLSHPTYIETMRHNVEVMTKGVRRAVLKARERFNPAFDSLP